MKIKTLAQFEGFLQTRIPTRDALFMGDIGLKRAKFFMKLLGNPQNKLKVIHIAGTSGKGSTAHLTSHILKSQGFSVGLSISPHVFDIRERMQVFRSATTSRTRTTNAGHANVLPSEKMVLKYFNQILPAILQMEKCKYGMPTFFEINVALAFFIFTKEKLDYAVMETGLGGTLDATNTISSKNKICIITKIGLDHTEILGKTISKIAGEKAGIIQGQNTTINIQPASPAGRQTAGVQEIITSKCKKQNSELYTLKPKINFSVISSTAKETVFDFNFVIPAKAGIQVLSKTKIRAWIPGPAIGRARQARNDKSDTVKVENITFKNIHLGLIGSHQAENCSLALACLSLLSGRGKFKINENNLRNALEKITVAGRMEILKIKNPASNASQCSDAGWQTIIVDGAHNPQKMEALTKSLEKIYPEQKFTFLVAFKKGKDFQEMIEKILPLADRIILTQFSTSGMDNHWSSIDNQEISTFLKSQNFKNFSIIENKKSDILKNIRASKKPVVITGSLYLISSIYLYLKNK